MVRATLLLILGAAGIGGCAALGSRGVDPRAQLHEGVTAVHAQEYLRARALLEPLVREMPGESIGQQAMLVLIAAELDSRNPNRRLWAAADMAGRLLIAEPAEPWLLPLAESYYLLAVELGAAEERVQQAEARSEALAQALPSMTRPTVPEQLGAAYRERDQARRQAEQLQQQLATSERDLRETRQELERIRRTIRP
ncbi:hypothetical protein BH23GEM9_BH23GEM9_00840 [soil metagenome]